MCHGAGGGCAVMSPKASGLDQAPKDLDLDAMTGYKRRPGTAGAPALARREGPVLCSAAAAPASAIGCTACRGATEHAAAVGPSQTRPKNLPAARAPLPQAGAHPVMRCASTAEAYAFMQKQAGPLVVRLY